MPTAIPSLEFRDLPVGAKFDFDHAGLPVTHGLEPGPWVKTGRRSYCKADDAAFLCKVGSIHVRVILSAE